MKLKDLIKKLSYLSTKGSLDVEVTDLSQSLNKKGKNTLLFCYKGAVHDTHDFCKELKSGDYACLVVERFLDLPITQILVKNTRNIMPKVCNTFFGNVTKKLKFIGITGTNGKTTTSSLVYNILQNANMPCALVGTNGIKYAGKFFEPHLTSPDTVDFFYYLYDMALCGIKYVVMEVSAHALFLNKYKGVHFDISLFTNLTQDHLDFFCSMGEYAKAKLKLLQKPFSKFAIINIDDRYGEMFSHIIKKPFTTFGLHNPSDNFAMDINYSFSSTHFIANVFDNVFEINTPLICEFNVYNTLGAMCIAKKLGVDNDIIFKTISNPDSILGRMNVYKLKNGAYAIIDYAHTPDGMEKVLSSIKNIAKKRIITLFGCGGDRDRLKRPKMGKIASALSDYVFVTSDNPRLESPSKIIANICDGITLKNYEVEENRTLAIQKAVQFSQSGDIILILGKGEENYIDINGTKIPYSDRESISPFIN